MHTSAYSRFCAHAAFNLTLHSSSIRSVAHPACAGGRAQDRSPFAQACVGGVTMTAYAALDLPQPDSQLNKW